MVASAEVRVIDCIGCKRRLPANAFYPSHLTNRLYRCKDCSRDESRLRATKKRLSDPEAYRQRANERARRRTARLLHDPRNARQRLLYQAKSRALAKGLAFDLTIEDVEIPDVCPLLGIPLIPSRGEGVGPTRNSPSLDRIDPKQDYVRGNVWVVSHFANAIKRDASAEDLIKIGTALLQTQQQR